MGREHGGGNKPLSLPLKMRDVSYIKPDGYEKYLTLTELSREVRKESSWLRKLEKQNRIPAAKRIQRGELSIRLWSPRQVDEIKRILSTLKRGRPKVKK